MKTKARTPGRRIPKPPNSWGEGHCPYMPGEYWKDDDGSFHGCTPSGLECWLKNRHVEEHEDGTISVVHGPWGSNSILVKGAPSETWHGEIQKGVWVEF
jgi:hypothetical protein